ncbi:MAG: type II toxin-antitoxin system VapC family toxin [Pirellulales bacterium]
MTRYFLDTSALVKRYHPEPGTAAVLALFNDPSMTIYASRLAMVECVSAFCIRIRSGQLAANRLPIVRKFLWSDANKGKLVVTRLLVRHLNLAEDLLLRHAPIYRLRSTDAIHLAVAITLFRNQGIDSFVSADTAQCHIARLEGLPTINPLAPVP